eukprot:jgi/Chlat1/4243/Chrsp27S04251
MVNISQPEVNMQDHHAAASPSMHNWSSVVGRWMPAAVQPADSWHLRNNNNIGDDNNAPSTSGSHMPLPSGRATHELALHEKTIAAGSAAVVSAVVVNPLDVVKTRLQAQTSMSKAHMPQELTWARMALAGGCPHGCTPRVTNCALHPCPPQYYIYDGSLDVINKIIQQEGWLRLWRGTGAALMLAVPTVGIYLPLYDFLKDKVDKKLPGHEGASPLIAGSAARSFAVLACSPLELARTRMQASSSSHSSIASIWQSVWNDRNGASSTGLHRMRGLWTGAGTQLIRDVPFSAIYWATLEAVRIRLLPEPTPGPESASKVFQANCAAGFLGGAIAAAATTPLDVIKTKRQIEADPARLQRSNFGMLREIAKDGGARALFTGVIPRVARAAPSCAIVITCYELVKNHFLQMDSAFLS